MQVTETSSEGLRREYNIVVPAGDIEDKLVGRLTEIGQSINVPGFRPGKVPIGILKTRYGDSVKGEILERTIQDATESALTENELRPAMQPKIEIVTFEDGADLEYKLEVEILPEIEQADFSTYDLERLVADVEDSEIESALQRMAEQRKTFQPVKRSRAAKSGDQVVIDFTGRIDGEAFEGGTATDFVLELGSGQFLPGFEDQLVGAKPGAKAEVNLDFPEDYPAENLKGKAAVFEVDVKELRESAAVKVDDEFAKSMGVDDLNALKDAVREQIEREYGHASRARLKRTLLDRLADTHDFELPPGMVQQEFDAIWEQIKAAKEQDRLDPDDKDKSEEELREQYQPIADRRVKLGLLLAEVGRTNNITVSQDDLNRAMVEQARNFPGQESRIFEYYQNNPAAMQELQAPIFEDKVVDFIVEMAKLTDRKVTIEELMADPDDQEAVAKASADEAKPEPKKRRKRKTTGKSKDAEGTGDDA
jgi:trigger factor